MKTPVSRKFAAFLLTSASFAAAPAIAQDAAAQQSADAAVEEEAVQGNAIIVTARRQDEPTAGAIVISTKRPTDYLEVSGKVSGANNETYSAAAVISGPHSDGIGFVAQYPNSGAFFEMIKDPDYQKAVVNRTAALVDSRLMRFKPGEVGGGFG